MISRRGLFRLLTGAGLSPVLKPLAALIPVSGNCPSEIPWWARDLWKQRSAVRDLEVYYSTQFLDKLRVQTALDSWTPRPLPTHEGKTIQFFTYKIPEGEITHDNLA